MFRDIGDKFGLIRAQIGIAKCLAQCEKFRESMNYYQLSLQACHETDNKVFSFVAIFFLHFLHILYFGIFCMNCVYNLCCIAYAA